MPQQKLQLSQAKIKINNQRFIDVDEFTLQQGDYAVIVGRNGSGKSSLANFLSQHQTVYSGEYYNSFNQIELLSLNKQQKLKETIFKDINNDCNDPDYQGKTATEIILGEDVPHSLLFTELTVKLGITYLLDRSFIQLSSGESRKVLFCRALLKQPELLVLDDPFEGLDQQSIQDWQILLDKMSPETTIVLIVNRLSDIPERANLMAILDDCVLSQANNKEQILQQPLFQQLLQAQHTANQPLPISVSPTAQLESNLNTLFDLKNVTIQYGKQTILQDLSLQIKRGENWWFKGPNGAGKSTLLAVLSGEHPQSFSNHVHIFGKQRGSGETIWQIKQHIGMVSNQLHLDYRINCSALHVVVSGYFDSIGVYQQIPETLRINAMQWLERVQMQQFANTPFCSLSWGQQRLLLIVRAMVKHPPILILDEPLQGLDGLNRQLILTFIEQLVNNSQTQLLFVSHYAQDKPNCITNIFEFIATASSYRYHLENIHN